MSQYNPAVILKIDSAILAVLKIMYMLVFLFVTAPLSIKHAWLCSKCSRKRWC